jgi:hypothetical protein
VTDGAEIFGDLFTNALSAVLERAWTSGLARPPVTIDHAVEATARELAAVEPIREEIGGEELRRFLMSPEALTVVRLLFVGRVHGSNEDTKDLRSVFLQAFARAVPNAEPEHGSDIFSALATGAERLLQRAADAGDAPAGQALTATRFRILREELAGVRTSVEDLQRATEPDLEQFLSWERLFRRQVLARHGTITPPTFDAATRVPVDDIYIEPRFTVQSSAEHHAEDVSSYDVLARFHRTVVLGDPGAGKSTFAQKLAYDLARDRARVAGRSLTPVLVTLKDYGAEKQRSRISLVDYMEAIAASDYNAAPPPGALTYLFAIGRLVAIFDGLDELLDTSRRRDLTSDIETFAARYIAAPILVTSRRVGYAQAPLDPRRFDVIRLSELDEAQVGDYARRWFGLRYELSPRQQQQMAADFIRDSATASDLRRNTLMLALLCNIYRGDGYIPRRRPQVYEKCAVMLFERWDRGRRIIAPLEFERHLRPAMQRLAHWIYADPKLRGGVTDRALVATATEFLLERRFDDEDRARHEAERFVEFCRGRAWVFTDTGTAPDGERLYQFTHRTFLEFFTAEYLVRTHRTPADLAAVLKPRIELGEWDVVAQLAFQLQDDNLDGAGDDLLADLLGDDPSAVNDLTLHFAARSLSFLVPRRETCRAVAKAVTRRACTWLFEARGVVELEPGSPADAHAAIATVDPENFDPVAQALVAETLAFLKDRSDVAAVDAALDVAANVDMAVGADNVLRTRWDAIRAEAFRAMWPDVCEWVTSRRTVAYDAFIFGHTSLPSIVEAHGLDIIFDSRSYGLYGYYIRNDLCECLLDGQVNGAVRPDGSPIGTPQELQDLAGLLAHASPPWDRLGVVHKGLDRFLTRQPLHPLDASLDGAAFFGAFATVAVLSERAAVAGEKGALLDALPRHSGWLATLAPWVRRRYSQGEFGDDLPPLPTVPPFAERIDAWSQGLWSAVAHYGEALVPALPQGTR